MPYSKSPESITRIQALLDKMLETDHDFAITPGSIGPQQMAYYVHQAIHASKFNNTYARYSSLASKWKIRPRQDKLIFELKEIKFVNTEMTQSLMKMVFDEITEVTGIVGCMVKHKPFEGFFPSAILIPSELETLYNWTSKNNYFIINHAEDGVTVTEEDIGVSWQPTTS